jgi:hypothetical protein
VIQKLKSKKEIRQEMEQEVWQFLNDGGEIEKVDRGISGRIDNSNINQAVPFYQGEKQTRTLVNETVKALDERKQKKKTSPPKKHKPQKKIIYDDFGDPIREIWE